MLFTYIFTQNKDFLRLYKSFFVTSKNCVVYYKKNNACYNRFGITTGKKIGNAVARNRARRIIKAAYRICENKFPIGFDIVVVARVGCGDFSVKSTDITKFFLEKAIPVMNNYPKKKK